MLVSTQTFPSAALRYLAERCAIHLKGWDSCSACYRAIQKQFLQCFLITNICENYFSYLPVTGKIAAPSI